MRAAPKPAPCAPVLTVVPAVEQTAPDTLAERIRRLQTEARSLARDQVSILESRLEEVAALAREIAAGGDAYPVGAREIARRLADESPRTVQSLEAIRLRH